MFHSLQDRGVSRLRLLKSILRMCRQRKNQDFNQCKLCIMGLNIKNNSLPYLEQFNAGHATAIAVTSLARLQTSHTLIINACIVGIETIVRITTLIITCIVFSTIGTVAHLKLNALPILILQARLALITSPIIPAAQTAIDLAQNTGG